MGKSVVQELVVGVDERPRIPEPTGGASDQRIQIASQAGSQRDCATGGRHQPDAPSAHRQCLPAVGPAVDEVGCGERDQIEPKERTRQRGVEAPAQNEEYPPASQQYRRQQEDLVAQTGQPPQQTRSSGRPGRCGLIAQHRRIKCKGLD